MSLFSLDGRVAVVTGAARPPRPASTAAPSPRAGATVVVTDLDGPRAAWTPRRRLARGPRRGRRSACGRRHRARRASRRRSRDAVLDRLGRVDVLVNNAALNEKVEDPGTRRRRSPVRELPARGRGSGRCDVNVTGIFLCCQVFGAEMAEKGRGASSTSPRPTGSSRPTSRSTAGPTGRRPSSSRPAYPTTKGAVLALHPLPRGLLGPQRRARQRALPRRRRERPGRRTSSPRYAERTPLGRMADAGRLRRARRLPRERRLAPT